MIPKPNQLDDFYRHLELSLRAKAAAERGHALLKEGKRRQARGALEEGETCLEKADLIAERWR